MIEICNLSHWLGEKLVLQDLNVQIPENSIVGLVGINGAGKSTLLRLLSGVYLPDQGIVMYDSVSPSEVSARQRIFFLPDDPYYTPQMTPAKLLQFYKTFYPQAQEEVYKNLLSQYAIDLKGKMRNFSKGMRRQVFIALALAVKPDYLLLDEAFDGLDPLSRKLFKDAIISLVEQEGCTVIISSHSLRELEDFCDRFLLLDDTKIRYQGDITEHIGGFCKFELAFEDIKDEIEFSHLPVRAISIRGHFVHIVLEGDRDTMAEELEKLHPAVMDEIPLDFEEVFIHDVQKGGVNNNEKRNESLFP